jgi:hypothetical protein
LYFAKMIMSLDCSGIMLHSSGTIVRSFVHSGLCTVRFDQRAEPRIVSDNDLEVVAAAGQRVATYNAHRSQGCALRAALCGIILRTFAHRALACGSMVLYRYCVSFFRPAGRKNDIQGIEHDRQAKVLIL